MRILILLIAVVIYPIPVEEWDIVPCPIKDPIGHQNYFYPGIIQTNPFYIFPGCLIQVKQIVNKGY